MSTRLRRRLLTSTLLHGSQFRPGTLHAIPQGHPELGLLLGRHSLPPLLDVDEHGVGDGMGGGGADGGGEGGPRGDERGVTEDRGAEHGDGWWSGDDGLAEGER